MRLPVPWRTDWIYGIGVFFFLLNICLFLMNCILISIRFGLRPGSFTNSFTDQVESLFIPAFVSAPPPPAISRRATLANAQSSVCIVSNVSRPAV